MIIEMGVGLGAGGAVAVIGGITGYMIARRIDNAKYDILVTQAKAKAKAIEHEAEIRLKNITLQEKEIEIQSKKRYDDKVRQLEREYEKKEKSLKRKDEKLNDLFKDELKNITKERDEVKKITKEANDIYKNATNKQKEYEKKLVETKKILEKISGYTQDEAKSLILKQVEEESREDIAHVVRKYEEIAKKDAEK